MIDSINWIIPLINSLSLRYSVSMKVKVQVKISHEQNCDKSFGLIKQ